MPKGFYVVSKLKFAKVEKLIKAEQTDKIEQILDTASFSTLNPMRDPAVAVTWQGNIIIENPAIWPAISTPMVSIKEANQLRP